MMWLSPIANGGGVVIGGFVAILQSAGAAGLGGAGTAAGEQPECGWCGFWRSNVKVMISILLT